MSFTSHYQRTRYSSDEFDNEDNIELKLPVKYYDQDIIFFGNLYQALHDQEKIALLLLSAKIEPSHTE